MKAENITVGAGGPQVSPADLFGAFIGADMQFDDCEAIAIKHAPRKLRDREAALFGTKWFDYRRLHAVQATYLFVHYYNVAYGDFLRQTRDVNLRFAKAIKGGDVFRQNDGKGHRDRLAFWRLRQRADEYGIRYDFFVRAAMTCFIEDGWINAPRPSHVDSDEIALRVLDAWTRDCRERLQWARHPFYSVAQWRGHPDQRAYEDSIVQAILRKPTKRFGIHAAVYERQALRIERAVMEFAEDDVSDAIALASESQSPLIYTEGMR